MSIPRAKIKRAELGFKGYDWTCSGCPGRLYIGYDELSETVEETTEHLYSAHGVRTVGSLTADDIGKWIEFPIGMDGRIAEVSHHSQEITSVHLDMKIGAFWGRPSTPCRVTEERP